MNNVNELIEQFIQNIGNSDEIIKRLEHMPSEFFEEEFCKNLIRKIETISPEKARELFKLLISKQQVLLFDLPKYNIFTDMTDEEYQNWCGTIHGAITKSEVVFALKKIPREEWTFDMFEILINKRYRT